MNSGLATSFERISYLTKTMINAILFMFLYSMGMGFSFLDLGWVF